MPSPPHQSRDHLLFHIFTQSSEIRMMDFKRVGRRRCRIKPRGISLLRPINRRHRYQLVQVDFRRFGDEKDLKLSFHEKKLKCAQAALAHYNVKKAVSYEFVEVVSYYSHCGSYPIDDETESKDETGTPAMWHHITFKAKPTSDGSPPEVFFAELFTLDGWLGEPDVASCVIINPCDPGNKVGCGFCPPGTKMFHPSNGLRAGNWLYSKSFGPFQILLERIGKHMAHPYSALYLEEENTF